MCIRDSIYIIHHFPPEPLSGLAGNIFCFLVVSFVFFLVGLIVHFCVCFLDVSCRFSGSELPQAQDSAVVRSSCAERVAVRIFKYSTLFWKARQILSSLRSHWVLGIRSSNHTRTFNCNLAGRS